LSNKTDLGQLLKEIKAKAGQYILSVGALGSYIEIPVGTTPLSARFRADTPEEACKQALQWLTK
jgi:hypothetical protein